MNSSTAPDNIESVVQFGGDHVEGTENVIPILPAKKRPRSMKNRQGAGKTKNWEGAQTAQAESAETAVDADAPEAPVKVAAEQAQEPATKQAHSPNNKPVTHEMIQERQNSLEEMRFELNERYGDVIDDLVKASKLNAQAAIVVSSPMKQNMKYFVGKRGFSSWKALGIIDRTLCRANDVFMSEAETTRAQKAEEVEEAIELLSQQRDELAGDELLMFVLFPKEKQILSKPVAEALESGISVGMLRGALAAAKRVRGNIRRLEQQRQKIVKDAGLLIKTLHGVVKQAVDRTTEESLRAGVTPHVLENNLKTAEAVLASKSTSFVTRSGYRGKSSTSRAAKRGQNRQQDNKSQGGKPKNGQKGNNM
jgi:polyhydroxyalkanoate synthesis regulator phasin